MVVEYLGYVDEWLGDCSCEGEYGCVFGFYVDCVVID